MSQNTAARPTLSQAEAEAFLFDQSECLDRRDFRAWVDLFTPDGKYWIPFKPEDTNPKRQMSFWYDDVPTLRARSQRLLDEGTGGQQPHTRSSHVLGNVRVVDGEQPGEVIVRSRFHATQFRRDTLRFYAGAYTHHLVSTEQGWKIRLQRVDLIDSDGIHDTILQVFI